MTVHILVTVAIGLSAAFASANDGVRFITVTSWQQALDVAAKERKPIFLDAYTDWCGWCKVMDERTFSDSAVAAFMNQAFVNVKMEMETGEGIDVAMKYRISSFPTFIVFSSDGAPTYKVMGFSEPNAWRAILLNMVDPAKAMTMAGATPTLKMAFPSWHRASFEKGKARKRPDTAVVQEWFESYANKFDEVAFGVIVRQPISKAQLDWVIDHEKDYRELYGSDFDDVLQRKGQAVFSSAVAMRDTSMLASVMDFFRPAKEEATQLKERLEAMYYSRLGDWQGLGAQLQSMSREVGASAASTINEYAWQMVEKCDERRALILAASAMKPIAERQDADWAHVDTYAALLYKTEQYDEAERYAVRAAELGTAAGQDIQETMDLLERIRAKRLK